MKDSAAISRFNDRQPSPKIAEKRARMRDRLLDSAGNLFAERGLEPVSVEEIIAAAGVSRRTFYSFFANKNELAAGLLIPALESGASLLNELPDDKPEQALAGLIQTYVDLWDSHANALALISSINADVMPYIETGHHAFGGALKRVLKLAEQAGALRNGDAQLSFKVVARTAVPLLKVYAGHPQQTQLYRDSMLALLGQDTQP